MDLVMLPTYVGYDNEHYLPDVRGYYLQKAKLLILVKFIMLKKIEMIRSIL